jgi:hypothetical protein
MDIMNRVQQAAIDVLKEHVAGIKVKPEGNTISVRLINKNASVEVQYALAAMAGLDTRYNITVSDSDPINVNIRIPEIQNNRFVKVEELASTLADSGINFPGSETYRSKTR